MSPGESHPCKMHFSGIMIIIRIRFTIPKYQVFEHTRNVLYSFIPSKRQNDTDITCSTGPGELWGSPVQEPIIYKLVPILANTDFWVLFMKFSSSICCSLWSHQQSPQLLLSKIRILSYCKPHNNITLLHLSHRSFIFGSLIWLFNNRNMLLDYRPPFIFTAASTNKIFFIE